MKELGKMENFGLITADNLQENQINIKYIIYYTKE